MAGAFVSKKSLDITARAECYLVNCFDRHLSSLQMDVHLTGIFVHLYLPTKIYKKTIKTEWWNQKAKTTSSQLLRLPSKDDRKIGQLLQAMQQILDMGNILDPTQPNSYELRAKDRID